jgi:hypothetical protein
VQIQDTEKDVRPAKEGVEQVPNGVLLHKACRGVAKGVDDSLTQQAKGAHPPRRAS